MKKVSGATMTHDYKRHGTTDLLVAMNLATGHVLYDTNDRHSSKEILAFLKFIDLHVSRELQIHVVLDNLSAHKAEPVAKWLAHPKRARWHALHTHQFFVTQPRRELVQPTHQPSLEEGHVHFSGPTRRSDWHLDRELERRSATIHMEEAGQRDHCEGSARAIETRFHQFRDAPLEWLQLLVKSQSDPLLPYGIDKVPCHPHWRRM
jgi:hypothetical protein